MLRRLAMTVALAVGAALSPITAAATAASTQPEHFVGVESTAGDEVNRYGRLQVDTFSGEELRGRNQAFSYSHDCTGCRSVTIAFQVILVEGSPKVVAPENYATAYNVSCTGCITEAFARQLVVQVEDEAELEGDERRAIAYVNRRLHSIAEADLTPQQREQKVDELWVRVLRAVCSSDEVTSCTDVPARTGAPAA